MTALLEPLSLRLFSSLCLLVEFHLDIRSRQTHPANALTQRPSFQESRTVHLQSVSVSSQLALIESGKILPIVFG